VSDGLLELLRHGEIEIEGRFANSSNTTLLVVVRSGPDAVQGVYKPESGERPLWDFPSGLWRREVAAWLVAEQLGIRVVPETVARLDGPLGPGSLQRYVDEDLSSHYFTLREDPVWEQLLKAIAVFDVVANNSDRKSGHVLLAEERLFAIDHGLCFHELDKLRTVIWDYAGEPLAPELREGLEQLLAEPPRELELLLAPGEIAATLVRAAGLLAEGLLPHPDEDRPYPPYPWPLV
jgi:hypothetical protein